MTKCIQPTYVKNFRCDGKACAVRCCRDWHVVIDDETFEKYSSLPETDREKIFRNVDETFKDEKNLPTIKMSPQGFCSFLDEDFLCKLQKNFGEDFLTAICQSYPRVTYKLSEKIFEQSMTLTCPVAAQKILLPPEPITFEELPEIKTRAIIDFTKKLSRATEDFLDVQASAIKILQDRNFSINFRLKKISELFGEENFSPAKFDIAEHSKILIEIFAKTYNANLDEQNKKNLLESYTTHRGKILAQVRENFSHVLENYLVNEFFMRCYPCAFLGDDWINCKIFVISFRLLEFALVLTTIAKRTLTVDGLLNLICSVNDMLDHSKGGMIEIRALAEKIDDEKFSASMLED